MIERPPPPFAGGGQALIAYLCRWFGSHQRPAVVYEWADLDLVDPKTMAALVREVWVGRNEKVDGDLDPLAWEELFDGCEVEPGEWWGDLKVPFTAYRAGHVEGMSWTTLRAVAERFAERGRSIYSVTITDPVEVLAYFADDRAEAEVVLRPGVASRSCVTSVSRASG